MMKAIEVFYRNPGWELRMVGNPAWEFGYCSTQEGAWGHAKRFAYERGCGAIMLNRVGRVRRVWIPQNQARGRK
jgi:hypothetical protein